MAEHEQLSPERQILDTLPIGVVVMADGKVVSTNPYMLDLLNCDEDEIIGHPFIIYNDTDPTPRTMEESIDLHLKALRPDGTTFQAIVGINNTTHNGQPAIIMAIDNVEEKRREETIKRQILARIGHQINEPLIAAGFILEMVNQARNFDPETQKLLTLLKKEHQRIFDILEIINNNQELELTPIDINQVAQKIHNDRKELFSTEKKQKLLLKLAANLPITKVDGDKIDQAIRTLLENATKFTPEDGVITITTSNGQNTVKISISDNGIGIPAEERADIFEPGRRGTMVDHISGSGLGLSYVKNIVNAHNGTVTVESQVGVGSTFTISLPRSS